jgi:prenyltransferase beta subunit
LGRPMTIRLDMRRAVDKGGRALGESVEVVRGFLRRQLAPEGGFLGRDGRRDLYYTVFGLEAALVLNVDFPRQSSSAYLDSFGAGESLDLVHLASLIRCRANLVDAPGGAIAAPTREAFAGHLFDHRSADGGFHTTRGASRGSAYGAFLALGSCQDLGVDCPDAEALVASINSLQMPEGGFANEPAMTAGVTTATAAAVCVLHYLRHPVPESALGWLLGRAHPRGGFTAIALAGSAGIPDLLSTATALHALSLAGAAADDMREKHLDYLDSLWSPQGGFRGHAADDVVDCEYTYYGLLALGSLVP